MHKVSIDLKNGMKQAKKGAELIKKLWENADNNNDIERTYYITDLLKDRYLRRVLSIYLVAKELDKVMNRNKSNQLFDVTKIKVSKNTDDIFREYDFKIVKLFHGDAYTDKKIRQDISMFNLLSGPSIFDTEYDGDFEIEDNFVYFNPDNILKERLQ